jgi:hypothetical protein
MLGVWAGPAMFFGWLVSFWLMAGYIPPPPPSEPAARVLATYQHHTSLIHAGLIISMLSCALLVPFSAVISVQLRRSEGERSIWTMTQIVSGGLLSLEFIFPLMFWQVADFRPVPSQIHLVQTFNDLGWITFVGVVSTAAVQFSSIGIVILFARGPQVFPRWLGYLNVWVALAVLPGCLVPAFKHGPFGWNGVLSFWLVFAAFCVWMAAMTPMLRRAVREDGEALAPPAMSGHADSVVMQTNRRS